jgi:2'-5' RNA ligase
MRIFIGIKLDNQVHDAIESFLKPFKKMRSPLRWVKRENVHLTLKFIGEISEDRYSQLEARLADKGYSDSDLEIVLSGCGSFGRRNDLDIFWLGIEKNTGLEDLFNQIEDSLAPLGIDKETRPFKPHITVGRNKKRFNFKSLLRMMEDYADRQIAQFSATCFQVFKSDLKPEGPAYTILKEIPLSHAQA